MSDRWSTSLASTCSGDMYSGVPMMTPAPVIPVVFKLRAIPKSMMWAFPPSSTMMFWGLRSRWTTPSAWASASPSLTCRAIETAFPTGIWPIFRMSFFRSSPATYSMVM